MPPRETGKITDKPIYLAEVLHMIERKKKKTVHTSVEGLSGQITRWNLL